MNLLQIAKHSFILIPLFISCNCLKTNDVFLFPHKVIKYCNGKQTDTIMLLVAKTEYKKVFYLNGNCYSSIEMFRKNYPNFVNDTNTIIIASVDQVGSFS